MPRTYARRALARGIYTDGRRLEIRVVVHGTTHVKHVPADTPLEDAKRLWRQLRAEADTLTPRSSAGSLAADAQRYLRLQRAQVAYGSKAAIVQHWVARLGHLPRHRITAVDVLEARTAWQQAGAAPKTLNHRVAVLRHLYRVLDGKSARTPCDDVAPLHVPKTPIQRVSDATILAVDAELQRREQHPPGRPYDGAKTRARFRVLVSTGRRPSEVMRAKPGDVDFEARVWVVRDGKGGWSPGIYLNDDMLAAWRLFAAANAWGYYNVSSFAVAIRNAGWPAHIRPYQARHTTWITAVERGADMADVQVGAGHKSLATTRIYTGVRASRMQGLSETLEGRFAGWPTVPDSVPQTDAPARARSGDSGTKGATKRHHNSRQKLLKTR